MIPSPTTVTEMTDIWHSGTFAGAHTHLSSVIFCFATFHLQSEDFFWKLRTCLLRSIWGLRLGFQFKAIIGLWCGAQGNALCQGTVLTEPEVQTSLCVYSALFHTAAFVLDPSERTVQRTVQMYLQNKLFVFIHLLLRKTPSEFSKLCLSKHVAPEPLKQTPNTIRKQSYSTGCSI